MKALHIAKKVGLVLLSISLLVQCREELVFDKKGILFIEVKSVDVNNYYSTQSIPNAEVVVYSNFANWAAETNPIRTLTADNKGVLTITGLSEGQYFLDIVNGELNNWETPYASVYDGGITSYYGYLARNIQSTLASPEGKDWAITAAYDQGGNEITDEYSCLLDNVYHFEKGGYYSMDDGDSRCEDIPQFQEGHWYGGYEYLNIQINSFTNLGYYIEEFSDTHFIAVNTSQEDMISYRFELIQ